jgi:hypothetical protein
MGRGEPLAMSVLRDGGGGMGRGEPLALRMLRLGGGGMGRGEPLAVSVLRDGGGGIGRGEPLRPSRANPGGGGMGRGEPLRAALETPARRLLDKCLTEVLTGSTIKIAATNNPRRTKLFFIMDELPPRSTMKDKRNY